MRSRSTVGSAFLAVFVIGCMLTPGLVGLFIAGIIPWAIPDAWVYAIEHGTGTLDLKFSIDVTSPLAILAGILLVLIGIAQIYQMKIMHALCMLLLALNLLMFTVTIQLLTIHQTEDWVELTQLFTALLFPLITLALLLAVKYDRTTIATYKQIWQDREILSLATRTGAKWVIMTIWVMLLWSAWIVSDLIVRTAQIYAKMTMLGLIMACYLLNSRFRARVKSPPRASLDGHAPAVVRGKTTHLSIVGPTDWGKTTRHLVDRSYRKRHEL